MPGKKNRPWKMGEPSRSWNILFSIKDIEAAELLSENLGITPAAVVRAALNEFLTDKKPVIPAGSGGYVGRGRNLTFEEGVDAAVEALRLEVQSPVFPSGQTLGDRLADKVMNRMQEFLRRDQ
jgi:hypothetical protein